MKFAGLQTVKATCNCSIGHEQYRSMQAEHFADLVSGLDGQQFQ